MGERETGNRVVSDLEKLAAKGEELPKRLTLLDSQLFLALRGLYSQYRNGIIDKEQASREKRMVMEEYEHACFLHNVFLESQVKNQKIATTVLKARKEGCPICQEIAYLYDGIRAKVPPQTDPTRPA